MANPTIQLELKTDDLRALFIAAYVKNLSQEEAQALVSKALKEFLGGHYQFNQVVMQYLLELIHEHLREDTAFRDRMKKLVCEAFERLLENPDQSGKPGELVERMARGLYGAMAGR